MEPAAVAPLPGRRRSRRARLAVLLSIIAALLVVANVGTILSANLAKDHPVTLLALSARNRHLLLAVAAGIGAVPYTVVSFLRLLAPAIAFFLLGTLVRRPGPALARAPGRAARRPRSGGSSAGSTGPRCRSCS